MSKELFKKHFPEITDKQLDQLCQLKELYAHWNSQINVISRKDIENFDERHVLHSLGIAKVANFVDGTKILDIGTGGGFPGIPLAIMFPNVEFHLVDSIGKKIKVVNEVVEALGLTNVKTDHERAENINGQYDFVVSRAVARMSKFMPWVKGKFHGKNQNVLFNGILYLKGGDVHEELSEIKSKHFPAIHELSKFFDGEFFETKKVVYFRMK
ncbi:MAG: 16S rRNA (guanine527-N7)-methyltransferase [Parvicella sp.]|jgi:16S rRNA (guanine527-N7)-methyltransferase